MINPTVTKLRNENKLLRDEVERLTDSVSNYKAMFIKNERLLSIAQNKLHDQQLRIDVMSADLKLTHEKHERLKKYSDRQFVVICALVALVSAITWVL